MLNKTLVIFLIFCKVLVASPAELDSHGGMKKFKLIEGENKWGVHQQFGRWWFSTPENHAYLPFGVNHSSVMKSKKFSEQYQKTEYFKKYGRNWSFVYKDVSHTLEKYGYNNGGYDGNKDLGQYLPYFTSTSFIHAKFYSEEVDYVDVFSEEFAKSIDKRISFITKPHVNNKNHIGYFWTDCIVWDIDQARRIHGTDWVSSIRSLSSETAGKKHYIAFLQKRYEGKENELKSLYGADFKPIQLDSPAVLKDDNIYLGKIATRYFETLYNLYRKYDQDALIFGDRFRLRDHPEEVLKALNPFIDALAIQVGDHHHDRGLNLGRPDETWFDGDAFDQLYEIIQKPIIICDHQCGFFDSSTPQTGNWYQYAHAMSAAKSYDKFMKDAFKKPYIIGYLRCQYLSIWSEDRKQFKQGILKPNGNPFYGYLDQIAKTHLEIKNEILTTK